MRVDHRRRNISMPEKLLHRPNVLSPLEKMRGKGMPEGVTYHSLRDSTLQRGASPRALHDSLMNVMPPDRSRAVLVSPAGRKNPLPPPFMRRHRELPRQSVRQPNTRGPVTDVLIMNAPHRLEAVVQHIDNDERQHGRTITVALRIPHEYLPAPQVDVLHSQSQRFEQP